MPSVPLVTRPPPCRRSWPAVLLLACAVLGDVRAQAPAQPAAEAAPRFDILEYRIEGNTVLSPERIERAVYPFLGEQRTVADVESARQALESAYRDAGYGTVGVDTPEQRIADGVVVLQVVEAPVSRLRVVGARYFSQGRILEKVPALAEGQVPNFKEATEQLATVNRSADRRVTPLLRPGKTPGTTEVDLTVEDKLPLHAGIEVNNKSSPNTTRSRLQANVRYDNLWQREHSVAIQAQVSPQDMSEVKVLSGSYTVPAGTGLWVFSAIRSDSQTVAGVGDTSVFGKGSIYGLRRVVVLDSSETGTQTLTLGADYKNFRESVTVGNAEGFTTPIRYLPFSASYAATRADKQGAWQAGAGLTIAFRDVASRQEDFANKRFRAQSNFRVLRADVGRSQSLPWWGLTLVGRLEGLYSDQALISNEQYVAGGVDNVRGYLEATAVGDKALRGSLELRSANLAPEGSTWLGGLRVHTFVDGAGLWLNSPLPQQDDRFGLLGAGFGLRAQTKQNFSVALDVGWPLRDVGAQKSGLRLHASGTFEF